MSDNQSIEAWITDLQRDLDALREDLFLWSLAQGGTDRPRDVPLAPLTETTARQLLELLVSHHGDQYPGLNGLRDELAARLDRLLVDVTAELLQEAAREASPGPKTGGTHRSETEPSTA